MKFWIRHEYYLEPLIMLAGCALIVFGGCTDQKTTAATPPTGKTKYYCVNTAYYHPVCKGMDLSNHYIVLTDCEDSSQGQWLRGAHVTAIYNPTNVTECYR